METLPVVINKSKQQRRQQSGLPFPAYSLPDSVAVAQVIHKKTRGYATKDQLAVFLGYRSTNNGAFVSRLASAKLFGLVSEETGQLKLSPLAVKILMPEFPDQTRAALVEAFFLVPLFKALYDEYHGKTLPEGLGFDNALRTRFQVLPKRVYFARKSFWESAEAAGFFEIHGSKTQLIIPTFKPQSSLSPERTKDKGEEPTGSGGGSGEPPSSPKTKSLDELQHSYIDTLIEALREKIKQGETDNELMERIERLLDLSLKTA